MPTLQDWINRRCACVHPDARECAAVREGRHLIGPDVGWSFRKTPRVVVDYECECLCHDLDEDDRWEEGRGRG